MKYFLSLLGSVIFSYVVSAQTNTYEISFENAVHHEAVIHATFPKLSSDTVHLRMSRTSAGRYSLHEFGKNVYNLIATDSKGNRINVHRPNPYLWDVTGHDGTVNISYTLFADRCDGTYSQIDETHAHLNIPATFLYAPELSSRKIELKIDVREDLGWKVATQMPKVSDEVYSARDLAYFMDSPIEISNHSVREFKLDSNGKKYNIQFVLHHNGTEEEFDAYFEKVEKAVIGTKDIYGELPEFEYDNYLFLACYVPSAVGDGMEHRNSTILTTGRPLSESTLEEKLVTVAHELFHSWNVERLRPKSLEPFDFEEANMSGELWFAEGVTTYYTDLILCRTKLITPERFVERIVGDFNYVWNSPGRQFFSPVEMSYQAPFLDGGVSKDPVNEENTFIDYYSYGKVLGLALDLSLRKKDLNLDDFMRLLWKTYGKKELPYTNEDLHSSLCKYAGEEFSNDFFQRYIYRSEMPNYESLFQSVGIRLSKHPERPYFGAVVSHDRNGLGEIKEYTRIGSPAYKAGLEKGDIITSVNGNRLTSDVDFDKLIQQFKVGDILEVAFDRVQEKKTTKVTLESSPKHSISFIEATGRKPSAKALQKRREWLETVISH